MTKIPTQMHSTTGFDQLLESAVVLNWEDLIHATEVGSVHVEYRAGAGIPLHYLKVWSSKTRGHWSLVCEGMWTAASHQESLTFSNHYYSAGLAQMLEFVIRHQETFPNVSQPQRDGLIQIHSPAQADKTAAQKYMNEAFEFVGLSASVPPC